MKKNILLSIIFITFFSLLGCGVILDSTRIEGRWKLNYVEFYAYNSAIDTNYTYFGIDDATPDSTHPLIASFFDIPILPQKGHRFYIDFKANKTMRIYDSRDPSNLDSDDGIVRTIKGRWSINNYENTINLRVYEDDVSSDNIYGKDGYWRKGGFVIKNYWPMSNYTTLELTIKSEDIGKQLYAYLKDDKKIKIRAMKGIFIKK